QAWQILGPKAVSSRFHARQDPALTPMLGRDAWLRKLNELWQRAATGKGQVGLIAGEPGIGKSRLAAALLEDTRPCATLRYFCTPYLQSSPLHPCIQQIEQAASFAPSDNGEQKLAKLEAALPGACEDDLALIAELLNLPLSGR